MNKISSIIKHQLDELNNWEKEIKEILSNPSKYKRKEIKLYLISYKNLEKYKGNILEKKMSSELINLYNSLNLIDNSLFYSNNINELPIIFVLNKNTWSSFTIGVRKERPLIYIGEFNNNILIFKLAEKRSDLNDIYEKIYGFFYLENIEKKREIGQGYIKIKKISEGEKIKDKLAKYGPIKFIENINNNENIIKKWYESNYFEIVIQNQKGKNKIIYIKEDGLKSSICIQRKSNNHQIMQVSNELKKSTKDMEKSFRNSKKQTKINDFALNKNDPNSDGFENKKIITNNYTIIQKNDNNKFNDKNKEEELKPGRKIIKVSKKRRDCSVDYRKKRQIFSNKENLNFEVFLPKKAIHKESSPGIIGLLNIGATCYMNATLQCFSNIVRLREYLLGGEKYDYLKYAQKIKKLSFSMAEVLRNLWRVLSHRYYAPENFKEVISEINPLFNGIKANDPKDLVLCILETIHRELNNPQNYQITSYIVDPRDFNAVYKEFYQNYMIKNNSIISEEFYGLCCSRTICETCNSTIYNIQSYNILFFPLEEVRKYMNYKINLVRINDCFEYYEKYEFYPSFYCHYCHKNCQGYQQMKLINTPKTLIINLNRGKGIEFNVNIIFEEYLYLGKYIVNKNSPFTYELIGIICHYGSNDMGGHFIAFCKNSNNCQWYKFNDQIVTNCSFNEVKQSGIPYVLFYSYVQQ